MSFCHSLHLDLSWVLYELFQEPFPLKQLSLLKSILIIHKVSTSSKSHLQTLIKPFFHQMGWKLNSRYILMNDNFYDVFQLLKKLLEFCLFFTNTCILIRLILTKNQLKIFWSHSAKFNQTLKGWSSPVTFQNCIQQQTSILEFLFPSNFLWGIMFVLQTHQIHQ